MRSHIDWLTFTIPMVYYGATNDDYAVAISSGLLDMCGDDLRTSVFGGAWEKQERSRAPYIDAWVLPMAGITLFGSPNLTHACIEISGSGCERLIERGLLNQVLECSQERVTRIDIACDIETEIRPTEFVEKVNHERMRTSGHVISDTGETCYVGSQKSERYARVYRYNKPHPRADLLRVEHVFRKDYAKKVAAAIVGKTLADVTRSAGLAFGWGHEIWQPDSDQCADISLISERRDSGKTVFWLVNRVAPAFKRLCADGTIKDPEAFINSYFMGD